MSQIGLICPDTMKETTIESSATPVRVDKHHLADRYLVSIRTIELWQAKGIIRGDYDGEKNTYDPVECDRRLLQFMNERRVHENN